MTRKTQVTVVGLGPMGATMAETFLKAGYTVTVWNRTASKAGPLVDQGAALAVSPAEALEASELIVLSQLDYQAMYDSLGGATGALKGRVLVNLSSDTPERLRAASTWAAGHGADLITAGIMTPPPGIGQPGAYTFYSGSEAVLEKHRETLAALSDVTYVGADHGLAMLYYTAQLGIFWGTLTGYMHALALVGSAGITPEAFRPYGTETIGGVAGDGPMGYVRILTEEIARGDYPGGENSLHMQAVSADHLVEASRAAGLDTTYVDAVKDLFWKAVGQGHGTDGLASVIEAIKSGPAPRESTPAK
ncbi:NAD(P)-binding domain-containing protein [Spirillospora sp. NPDC047279]|uniref:NAD(P)-dependent oxidoreductase n=1 Tax=Spirillospora sp. NPDC047279 TaxID=3155478 RepID=UPI0033C7DAFE